MGNDRTRESKKKTLNLGSNVDHMREKILNAIIDESGRIFLSYQNSNDNLTILKISLYLVTDRFNDFCAVCGQQGENLVGHESHDISFNFKIL